MKKLLSFAILGMSTLAFGQAYTYTSYGVANGGTTYSVPDANADEVTELAQTSGQKFSKFDLSTATFPSTPTDDRDKTFGNNNTAATDVNGTDTDRGWTTNGANATVTDPGYYSCVRQVAAVACPRAAGLWAYHTVNFTEAGNFNPILRFRDGSKNNVFVISIYSSLDMSKTLYNETVNLNGAAPGVLSSDNQAKYLVLNGTSGASASVWYKIVPVFNVPSAGNYIVKISQTTTTGSVGLGSFTFWKEAAATAPEVAITAPATNSVFEENSTINLTAIATAGDGIVSGVEFFDGATSIGMGTLDSSAIPAVYKLDVPAGASKVYDFKAVVTETGGAAPDTAMSLSIKVLSIGTAEDNFDGTNYPGLPWNGTKWSFGADNTANYAIGAALGVAPFKGVPFFAYDLGAVDPAIGKSEDLAAKRYVAGAQVGQLGTSSAGIDLRSVNAGTNVFKNSDLYSRDATTAGSGRFVANSTDSRFLNGGAWARYSCTFAPGKYKFLARVSGTTCNANFNTWVRILTPQGVLVGTYMMNGGTIAATTETPCASLINATRVANAPGFEDLTDNTGTHWVLMGDEISIDGPVVVEISDPDPVNGANSPTGGTLGEFTFSYTSTLSNTDYAVAADFDVLTKGKSITVVGDDIENATVTIFDASGKLIVAKSDVNSSMTATLPSSGLYIVKVQAAGKNAKTVKVMVN